MKGDGPSVFHPAGVLLGAVLTAITMFLAEMFLGPLVSRAMSTPEERMISIVHGRLLESYVSPTDPEWLMHRAVEGMVDGLNDPYTVFVGPEQMADLEEESSGQLIGIGVILDGRGNRVRYPLPGGPAEDAGLLPGDLILGVDGEDVTSLPDGEVAQRIKGPLHTTVQLEVQRHGGELYSTQVLRRPVPRGTVGKVAMVDPERGIGRIRISGFSRTTPAELDEALGDLQRQGLRGLVLDLRFNTGGLLDAAVEVAARFLNGGVVCHLRTRGSRSDVRVANPDRAIADDIPLVVLLNGGSASGSEVVAGALRDRGAAVLAGSKSFGKGVFQEVHRYPGGDFAIKFTAGYYVTPAGRILEGHIDQHRAGGLEPDLAVPVDEATMETVYLWLAYEEPPEEYRDAVYQLFPRVAAYAAPADPVLDSAVQHLQLVLEGA